MTYPYETATEEQRRVGAWWWCVHHEIHCEPLTESINNRVAYILENKPPEEHERRLRELRPVLHPERLPKRLRKAWAEYDKAWAELDKAGAECEAELMALHLEEYPDTKWNGKSIFAEDKP